MDKIEKCLITGLPVTRVIDDLYDFKYWIKIGDLDHALWIKPDLKEKLEEEPLLKSLLCGVLALNMLNELEGNFYGFILGDKPRKVESIYSLFPVDKIYDTFELPTNQIDKTDFQLRAIYSFLQKPGSSLSFTPFEQERFLYFFCQDISELHFFCKGFGDEGLLRYEELKVGDNLMTFTVHPTIKGYQHIFQKETEVQKDLCFVAMSFGADETPIFTKALKPAIEAAGYQARRVDDKEHHIDKEQTINDSILALAKKANFVVCDYTGNKRGVYFEHGYAWGMGKKVIMTVKESEMADLHFDVSHYPFIVWKDYEDLRIRLQAKIESWIGRYEP